MSLAFLAGPDCSSAVACDGRVYIPHYRPRSCDHLLPAPGPLEFGQQNPALAQVK